MQPYPSSSLLIWSQNPNINSQSSCLLEGLVALSEKRDSTTWRLCMWTLQYAFSWSWKVHKTGSCVILRLIRTINWAIKWSSFWIIYISLTLCYLLLFQLKDAKIVGSFQPKKASTEQGVKRNNRVTVAYFVGVYIEVTTRPKRKVN